MYNGTVFITTRSFGSTSDDAVNLLKDKGYNIVRLKGDRPTIESILNERIGEADGIIAGLENYSAELLEKATNLKIISRYGVGYNNVDLEAAKNQNIAVTITPGTNGDSVADMAMALMLACARGITFMDRSIKSGEEKSFLGVELSGKTVGIVGPGSIGKKVISRCKGFNMNVVAYSRHPDATYAESAGISYVDLDTLIKESDFISIHTPLSSETKNLFGVNEFDMMKSTAVIVNTSRGGIIDEDALYDALKEGKIKAAGLDVVASDKPSQSKLKELDNCILTPHKAGSTADSVSKMSMMATENLIEYLEKGTCANIVSA